MCCGGYNGYAPPSAFAQRRNEEIRKQFAENKTAERVSVSSQSSESAKEGLPEKAPVQSRRSRFGDRLLSKIRNSMWSQIDLRTLECSCIWWVHFLISYSGLANKNYSLAKPRIRGGVSHLIFLMFVSCMHSFLTALASMYRLYLDLQNDLWIHLHISNNIIIQ